MQITVGELRFDLREKAGYAVAIPMTWKTAGEFKRLQRIINSVADKQPTWNAVAVDGQIGPATARTAFEMVRRFAEKVAPAWDMTTPEQVEWVAKNVLSVAATLARIAGDELDDYSNSNAPAWLLVVSPVVWGWYGRRALM